MVMSCMVVMVKSSQEKSLMQKSKSKKLCHTCDLVVQLPRYRTGVRCICPQCQSQLRSGRVVSLYNLGVISIASVIMLLTSITLPYLSISALGISRSVSLTSIFFTLKQNWELLLYICILFTFMFPLIMHSIIIAIVFFRLKVTVGIANLYTLCHRFSMVDVFILGVLVSLIKLVALADVKYHIGFYCSIVFALMMVWCFNKGRPYKIWEMVYDSSEDMENAHIGMRGLDQGLIMCRHCGMVYKRRSRSSSRFSSEMRRNLGNKVYSQLNYLYQGEQKCPRCHHNNDYRAPHCYQKSLALLLTAAILYLPSNIYPIMFTEYLGSSLGSTIIDGVISLWQMGSYFVASVILIASICIPVLKIMCMLFLLTASSFGSRISAVRSSRLYRVVLFIGRWSMIDVFVVIIMSTVVQMSGLLTISPGIAIVFFCFVVLITMIAAEEYDERLLWDQVLASKPQVTTIAARAGAANFHVVRGKTDEEAVLLRFHDRLHALHHNPSVAAVSASPASSGATPANATVAASQHVQPAAASASHPAAVSGAPANLDSEPALVDAAVNNAANQIATTVAVPAEQNAAPSSDASTVTVAERSVVQVKAAKPTAVFTAAKLEVEAQQQQIDKDSSLFKEVTEEHPDSLINIGHLISPYANDDSGSKNSTLRAPVQEKTSVNGKSAVVTSDSKN